MALLVQTQTTPTHPQQLLLQAPLLLLQERWQTYPNHLLLLLVLLVLLGQGEGHQGPPASQCRCCCSLLLLLLQMMMKREEAPSHPLQTLH
jgi:hypothetical protein